MTSARVRGAERVNKKIELAAERIMKGAVRGLRVAILFLEGQMKEVTPVGDTGNLINSYTRGVDQRAGEVIAWIRNSAEYAVYVHEAKAGTRFRKPGATNKFMERPLLDNQRTVRRLIEMEAKR